MSGFDCKVFIPKRRKMHFCCTNNKLAFGASTNNEREILEKTKTIEREREKKITKNPREIAAQRNLCAREREKERKRESDSNERVKQRRYSLFINE